MPDALLLTVPEACRMVAVSRAHLYRLIGRGEIDAAHIGRLIRIPRTSLDAYVARVVEAERDRPGGEAA